MSFGDYYAITFQTIAAVAAAVAAVYGVRNHLTGQDNKQSIVAVGTKVDAVQESTDGTQHKLAESLATTTEQNNDLARKIAASTLLQSPPTAPERPAP